MQTLAWFLLWFTSEKGTSFWVSTRIFSSLETLSIQSISEKMSVSIIFFFFNSTCSLIYFDCVYCHGTIVSSEAQFATGTTSEPTEMTSYFPKGPDSFWVFKRMCPVWLAVTHIPLPYGCYRVTPHTTCCVPKQDDYLTGDHIPKPLKRHCT